MRAPIVETLGVAYADLAALATSLDEADSWCPTGCAGWMVRDLVFHLLGDAQRALVALATPTTAPADRDAVTYWHDAPGAPDPESRGIRATRTMASVWRLEALTATYAETSSAVVSLAERTPLNTTVATQGHVLRVGDLLDTLVSRPRCTTSTCRPIGSARTRRAGTRGRLMAWPA